MVRNANPTLNTKTFEKYSTNQSQSPVITQQLRNGGLMADSGVMTVNGTLIKAFGLGGLVLASASYTWHLYFQSGGAAAVMPWMITGMLCALAVGIATCLKFEWAPVMAPAYAIFEGFAIGGISALLQAKYPGIVVQAVSLTFGTLFAMLGLYLTGMIKPTEKFQAVILGSTCGIALVYLINMFVAPMGLTIGLITSAGTMGILASMFITGIAALNLICDFEVIKQGAAVQAPAYMEWYAAFGLMVTMIWLYLEVLRLLGKSRR